MRFYTQAWYSGELSEEEELECTRRYHEEHIPALLPRLPRALAELARGRSETGEALNIHDALVRRVLVELEPARVTLELRAAQDASSCADLDLEFRGVDLARLDRRLWKRVARKPRTTLLYDEVDLETDGRFAWRVLLWPSRAAPEIVFREFTWSRRPQPDWNFARAPDPYVERA